MKNVTFNSRKNHNTNYDILEYRLNENTTITYTKGVSGNVVGSESMEYYRGANYIVGSNSPNYSRVFTKDKIPPKYRKIWNELKKEYENNYADVEIATKQTGGYLQGLTLPFKYEGGAIIDGAGKTVIMANRENSSPISPAGRDGLLQLVVVLLNEAFEYDKAVQILKKLGYL